MSYPRAQVGLLGFMLTLAIASSCSVSYKFYLQNASDRPLTLELTTLESIDSVGIFTATYGPIVERVRYGTYKQLKEELSYRRVAPDRYQITVPGRSTAVVLRYSNVPYAIERLESIDDPDGARRVLIENNRYNEELVKRKIAYTGNYLLFTYAGSATEK